MTFYQIMSKEYANYEGLVHCSVQVRLVSDRENGSKKAKAKQHSIAEPDKNFI